MQQITFCDQTLFLHPFRAIYWQEQNSLLLADLHLGKAAHFRKAGLAVPVRAGDTNWDRLMALLFDLKPARVLFLGDLFHSEYNPAWEDLTQLIQQFQPISFELIPGNHDVLEESIYKESGLVLHATTLSMGPFFLTHHPQSDTPIGLYNIAGHIHPSVRLQGAGRQSLRLPCFYFGVNGGLLPAFGAFTGTADIPVTAEDRVFVIAEGQVLEVE